MLPFPSVVELNCNLHLSKISIANICLAETDLVMMLDTQDLIIHLITWAF